MSFIAAAIIGGVATAGASYMASRSQRKAQQSQNDANARMAQMANEMDMERYYQSRGAAMGATYSELVAKPGDSNYDPELSMFNEDGSAKKSAVLPLYLSELEGDMAESFQDSYNELDYDGLAEYNRLQNIRQGLGGAEQGMVDTVNQVYDGTGMSTGQQYLDSILNTRLSGVDDVRSASQAGLKGKSDARFAGADGVSSARFRGADAMGNARLLGAEMGMDARLRGLDEVQQGRLSASQAEAQAILNEGQRNAANADYTGRSGIVGASGNSQAATLSALMNAYANAGVNAANNRVLNAQDAADVYLANAQDLGSAYVDNATDANKVYIDNASDLNKIYLDNASEADALARDYASARSRALEQGALADYALYEQNLQNRKLGQTTGALSAISANSTAGLNNIYAKEDATSNSLRKAGMQIGQGRTPEVNIPSYTAPVKESVMGSLAQGLQGGVSTYLMANALFPGGGGVSSKPDVPSPKPYIGGR